MPLKIFSSNRMETLVDALAGVVARPLSSPFTPELIVLQSKGMQRWLSMELARRFGVWANCSYPFPNAFISSLFSLTLPDRVSPAGFSPEVMTWKLFARLAGVEAEPLFAPLRHYLADDRDELKRFQLAQRLADTFDQYTLFRPDMVRNWEMEGAITGEEAWQAQLWRELSASGAGLHRGRLKEEFCRLMKATAPAQALPQRVALFGASYLPAYHLEIIAALARTTEVNLFLLCPTREYWADVITDRARSRLSPEEQALRFEGNPLLASLGKLGRDFSSMAIELAELAESETDLYSAPAGDSLLVLLQTDILNLSGAEEGREKIPVAATDRSLQIHSCHSPLREMEILYDQLLALLEENPDLEPRDILVMTPDIELYAPYISAVFAGVRESSRRIPFSIADRRLASEGEIASALIRLLALPGSRFTAGQLLDILSFSPVMRRFGLAGEELATIRAWLEKTRVRWGLDEAARLRLGLPPFRANSWRAGLDRLLLGYAMSGQKGDLFHEMLPFDDLEGGMAGTLGKLADFVSAAGELAAGLEGARSLCQWGEKLREVLAAFISADDADSRELATVAALLEELVALEGESGYSGQVPFAVIRAWLGNRLQEEEKGLGFMTGGVTFCAMLPMRSIPFPVIALVGMNDGAFPRQTTPDGFDLIARLWRPGDRSLRDEDRYLFLETLLSARRALYVSYIGQSMADNSELPPSVLLAELLDTIQRGFTAADGGSLAERLVTRHRLQAFSRNYFAADSPLFSYSEENCAALLAKNSGQRNETRFMPTPMAAADEEWKTLNLHRLLRFIVNPAQFFVENRLGIRLGNDVEALQEREPFALDPLDSYSLKTDIFGLLLKGEGTDELLARVRSLSLLPPGRHGDSLFAEQIAAIRGFANKVGGQLAASTPLPPLDVALSIGGFTLSGRLDAIRADRMYRYRCATMKGKDLLKTWLEHLALNAAALPGYPLETVLIMTDKALLLSPVADAGGLLQSILELYWLGLTRPLPFFPESALAYATAKPPWDINKARSKWNDSYSGAPGEGSDPCFRLCFAGEDPYNGEFERIARTVMEPVLLHSDKVSL
jgi:exodeoxyribonuclease V gamma subunit